jgi:hypothetical protein
MGEVPGETASDGADDSHDGEELVIGGFGGDVVFVVNVEEEEAAGAAEVDEKLDPVDHGTDCLG